MKFMADSPAKKESWMSSLAEEIKHCVTSVAAKSVPPRAPSPVLPPVAVKAPSKEPKVAPPKTAKSSKEIIARLQTAGKSFKDKEDLMKSFEQEFHQQQKTVLQLEKLLSFYAKDPAGERSQKTRTKDLTNFGQQEQRLLPLRLVLLWNDLSCFC